MKFDWAKLVGRLWGRSTLGRFGLEARGRFRAGRRARRRQTDHWPAVEPMEVRVLLAGTPTLTVLLSSQSMSEFAGGNGIPATVQRTDADLSQSVTVNLSSSDTTEASVPASVVIPAGAASAPFTVLPVDDRLLDGPQSVQITASAPGYVYSSTFPGGPAGLDTTFGTGGYSSTPLAWALSSVYPDMLLQPDGAIVSLSQTPSSNLSWTLTRKTANGAADASFGVGGGVTTTFSSTTQVAPTSLARQSDGKILAAGHISGGVTIWDDLTVVRYNTNGSLDSSFGTGGIVRIERTTHTIINEVTVLGDGSILIAGAEGNDSFLAKLSTSGALVSSFGTNGVVITHIPGSSFSSYQAVTIQTDGKILAAGRSSLSSGNGGVFSVARYTATGALDTSYDFDGMQQIDTNTNAISYGVLQSAVLQADGKLVLAGYDSVTSGNNDNWAIVRLNTNGSPDPTFSGDGLVTLDFNGLPDYANDVVIQPDGKLLVMGAAFVSGNGYDLGVARFNTDGTLDPTFDDDGKLILPNWAGTIWEEIWAGQLNATGQLVFLAGYNTDMRVGRLNLSQNQVAPDTLTVTDAESLIVSIIPTSVAENAGPAAVQGTVTRSNTDDLSADLVVSLLSSDTTELTVPATVTIPAGQASATFSINAVDDSVIDGTQTVTISASAAGYSSIGDTLSVTDNDANVAPVVDPRTYFTNEEVPVSRTVTGTDADGDALTFSVFVTPTHGQVTMNADGSFVYTPALDFAGTDSFKYRAHDGKVFSNAATVTISVQGVNDAPRTNPDSYVLNEDEVLVTTPAPAAVTRIQMASDPNDWIGQGRTYDLTPATGTIAASSSGNHSVVSLNYRGPTGGDFWSFSFASASPNIPLAVGTYDGATRYPFNSGTPGLDVSGQGRGSNTLTGTFTILAISFAPTGALQSFYATFEQHSEGAPPALRGTVQYNYSTSPPGGVLVNDTDVDGDAMSAALITGPVHGTLALNADGSFSYTPDHDYFGSDSFTYKASDGQLQSAETTVSLVVNPVDDPPSIDDQSFAIAENSPAGATVGTVVASDDTAGQTLMYAITASSLPGAFAIDAATGLISVADGSLLDHEQVPSVALTVSATQSGTLALSSSATITVAVDDVNEAPVITTTDLSVAENAAGGSVVGTVAATDADAGQTLGYEITSSTLPGAFTIDGGTGEITVVDGSLLDFESQTSVDVTVRVTDDGDHALAALATITIALTDVNEAPVLPDRSFSLAENPLSGATVGTVTGTDPDANQTLSYAITAGNVNGAFAIDPVTGAITVANPAAIDFETTPTFALSVTATDDGAPALSTTASVTVSLSNANDAPSLYAAAVSIPENLPNGSLVFAYATIASDQDPGQTLTYSIAAGNTSSAFAIDSRTGLITVKSSGALNFEVRTSFALTITVKDNGVPARSSSAVLTVNLTNVNEPPAFAGGTLSLLVAENSLAGKLVGKAAAPDPDAGQTVAYAIVSGNTNGAFSIDGTGSIRVANPAAIDFESSLTSFTLVVTATDSGTPALSATKTVQITVTNVNEAPVIVPATLTLAENSAAGTSVGTIAATDPDPGQTRTFAITGGNTSSAFAINPATGELTVNNPAALNFEKTPQFLLKITATDNGSPAKSGSATITVRLANVNEAPIVAAQSFAVKTKSAVGRVVGRVVASDPDAGQTRTYAIVSGNGSTGDVFAINAATGAISVSNAIGVATDGLYELLVQVSDNGSPSLSTIGTIRIYVNALGSVPS